MKRALPMRRGGSFTQESCTPRRVRPRLQYERKKDEPAAEKAPADDAAPADGAAPADDGSGAVEGKTEGRRIHEVIIRF